jgi:hypothetical protein
MPETTIIVTMAGASRRFFDAGYTVPKYMLEAHGHSVFSWSALSLVSFAAAGGQFICVCRKDASIAAFIRKELLLLGLRPSSVEVVGIGAPTDGQATTALLAGEAVKQPDNPVLIYNIDTHCNPQVLRPETVRGDGWVPCFSAPGNSWSFALAGADGRASRIVEKKRISDDCTLGLYWFRSFASYVSAYRATYLSDRAIDSTERYVAPLYNTLIEEGWPVYIERIASSCVIPMGTPVEYESFLHSSPPRDLWSSTVSGWGESLPGR